MARSNRDPGRCDYPDLLRAVGGGGIDADGNGGITGSDRNGGTVLFSIQRPRQSFFCDAEGWREGGQAPANASGASDEGIRCTNDCGVFAAGARTLRKKLWNLAGALAAGAEAGGHNGSGKSESVSTRKVHWRVQYEIHGGRSGETDGISAVSAFGPEMG